MNIIFLKRRSYIMNAFFRPIVNVEGFGSGETKTERLILIKNLHCLKLQFDICKSLIPFILLDFPLLSTIIYMKVQCNI